MITSYVRCFISGVLTLYMAGETSPRSLLAAGVGAVIPPLLRWLNPNDKAYGRGSQES
jgi:hypothetical protein